MKRRKALKIVGLTAVSLPVLPGCEPALPKIYSKLSMEFKDYKLIERLVELVLPYNPEEIVTPETTTDFVLTHINDCSSPEDQSIFMDGLKEVHFYLSGGKQDKKVAFHKKKMEEQEATLKYLVAQEYDSSSLKYFFKTILDLTRRHFTTSKYFMTEYLDFEFIPGRFKGCVPV